MAAKRLTARELEEMMTEEERALFVRWRNRIGEEFTPTPLKEALSKPTIYIFGWGAEVSSATIKRWAIANEDFNALWFDEEYAKKSRWGGIIAPPMYLLSCHDGHEYPMEFFHYMEENLDKFPTYAGTVQGEIEWEFFEQVRPGDAISFKHKLADVYWKEGKENRLLFIVGETALKNQKGQLVATNRGSAIFFFKYTHKRK
jgi:acyl dehydratase